MLNDMNRSIILGTVYLNEEEGMSFTSTITGKYDKKLFSEALEIFHLDCDTLYKYDLQEYWENN